MATRDQVIDYIAAFGGRCRDCADEFGVCPQTGIGCGERRKAIGFVLDAYSYGVKHGFITALDAALTPGEDIPACTGCGEYPGENVAMLVASLSAKVAEVELANADLELIADENADNVRLIDKIAKLIGIPHDQELTIQDVHVWKHAVEARASELQREVERLRKAIDDALGRHQVTHIHAGLRAALQQEGE